ncbi:acetylornithine deacetylase [Arthroderma uncinatum]|uniref:acetylornithine deacetylase n=1 Tax=Arthroderma uncinatum TaxID=74035 RepID=UPI00144A5436|nr:acetylornithine deacetylase [Arthroderma uncinatum]KAF3481192.1 acetylornithine deacetylase [Arthroderma uncinatum]
MAQARRTIYHNSDAKLFSPRHDVTGAEKQFHQSLPSYEPSPLVSLDKLAKEIGVAKVFIKNESNRLGLPSFKILGASWATYQAVSSHLGLSNPSLDELSRAASSARIKLLAATEGNHGRAVGRMAKILGISSEIFVGKNLDQHTRDLIAREGATVTVVEGDYDEAVSTSLEKANESPNFILIQDTAFKGYEKIPAWIVQGYSTMLTEIDDQLKDMGLEHTVMVTPVGVGSLCQAVVSHCKANSRAMSVLTVEPDVAPCLYKSLKAGQMTRVMATKTIMSGLECGTVSTIAWPILQSGVDASVTISDHEAHQGVQYLSSKGVNVGPCGAAGLSGLRHVAKTLPSCIGLSPDSVVVIIGTEGSRPYTIPKDVSSDDSVELTQILTQINSSNPSASNPSGVGESDISDYIISWLEHRDLEAHRLESTVGRPSVMGVLRGTGGGKSLMLNGHTDTVTLDSYSSDLNPLSGELVVSSDGRKRIVGRGTLDMKAGIAASMSALASAKLSSPPPRGDVILAAVADEEFSSIGTKELLKAGWRADGAIVVEPTQQTIAHAHKGMTWLEIEILGVAAHGSRPNDGVDAILLSGYFLTALKEYEATLPEDSDLGKASLHASLIKGGIEPNSYPASCKLTVEFRTIPVQSAESIVADVIEILTKIKKRVVGFKYRLPQVVAHKAPFEIAKDHPLSRCVYDATGKVYGTNCAFQALDPWTDAALLHDAGIPSIVFGQSGAGLHSEYEWVDVESIRRTEGVLSTVIEDFCS